MIEIYSKPNHKRGLLMVLVVVCFLTGLGKQVGAQTQETSLKSHGVVLTYHRFGESEYPSTNITLPQFTAHIEELKTPDKYNLISLPSMIENLKQGVGYDKRTVAISVDDAFKSVYLHAWPRLKTAGIPLTVFVATDTIDAGSNTYMTWDDLRELVAQGVTIGHHGASHKHYLDMSEDEIAADLAKASRRFMEELGFKPTLFAYPYGEYDKRIKNQVIAAGLDVAFTQLSGPLSAVADKLTLPRFPLNERYADVDRFKLITGTVALNVEQVIPVEPLLAEGDNPPTYGFSLINPPENLSTMACYPSHLGRAAELTVFAGKRVEIRFDEAFPKGRNKINCTMPAGNGRWFWLGGLFIVR